MSVHVHVLGPDDAVVVRELRLRALREHPDAFAASYEEERALGIEETVRRLAPTSEQATLGAFLSAELVGIAAVTRPPRAKLRHRATIAAMYVAPEARGLSLGRNLLEEGLALARAWGASEVAVAVTTGNQTARNLYVSAGFIPYGVEPRMMYVDGRFYDVELMNLHLPQAAGPGGVGA